VSRSRLAALVAAGLGLLLLGLAAGRDWCAGRRPGRPEVQLQARAEGPLLVGAATAPLDVPFPAVVAGYGVPRASVRGATAPVQARALVVQSGGVRVGLVVLDVLVGDAALERALRAAVARLQLTELWVAATHTHSGPGSYAANWVAQLAGTGRLQAPARDAVVAAAARALTEASEALVPVTLRFGEGQVPELVGARSRPADVDVRLSRLVFDGATGPVAQLLVLACHPTLAPRPPSGLDPDWPGRLSDAARARGEGVTLVLQGAVGNASSALHESNGEHLRHFVTALGVAVEQLPLASVPSGLAVSRVGVGLPGPDASHLVPGLLRPLADNLLCALSPARAEVTLLQLGPLRFLGVPGEPSAAAGRVLEHAAGATRVVSLVGGYLGYVETPGHLASDEGEAERQLVAPAFLEALTAGASAARAAVP
jgi:neutral ceramidase